MKNLAIIPARSGSKGVKDKNIRLLNNKPLIAYSIDAAFKSNCFDEVMVSTDSEEYSEIARRYGAEVPFLRSKKNSSDIAGSWDMVREVITMYQKENKIFNTVCLLQPTSPLRDEQNIKEAYKIYEERASVAVISVCKMEHSPLWSNVLPQDYSLDGFVRVKGRRRQDTETYYRLNGAIYIVNVNELLSNSYLYRSGSYAYLMCAEKSVDIDTELDFMYAEMLMKQG